MKTERKRQNKRKTKGIFEKIALGFLSVVVVLVLVLGLAGIIIYKSGEIALKASANTSAPAITVNMEEVSRIKETLEHDNESGVAWQDGWIAYDGKVYEYRENMLNFLLLGIDRGGRLSSETQLSDWNAGQADTIFLVAIDMDNKKISVIGIPRNSMVDVEVYDSENERIKTIYDAICLQYGYAGGGSFGLEKMKESVSELMCGLPLHGAVAVSFDAVSIITGKLGNIEVVVPDDMTPYDPSYKKGSRQKLTKKNVMDYLRYRDSYKLGSPTVRLTRQKEFMRAAADKALDKVKSNPVFVKELYEAVSKYMNTDITLDKAVYTASKALECKLDEQSFYQLTGEDKAVYFTNEDGGQSCYDDYYIDEDALKKIMVEVFYKEVNMAK